MTINIMTYLIFLWKLEVVIGLKALLMICQVHDGDGWVAGHACQLDRLWVSHRSCKRAPIEHKPTVISLAKAACVFNRGNGRVGLVKACRFTQSSGHAHRENMDTEANEKSSSTLLELSLLREKNVIDRESCRVELAWWKDTNTLPKNS